MTANQISGTVVVTGAASGIGAATARRLQSEGWQIVAVDLQPPDYPVAQYIAADLGDPSSIEAAVAQMPSQLHGLCNIAGLPGNRGVERTLRVNFLGLRHLTHQLLPRLQAGSGIVNLASVAGNQWRDRWALHREWAATPDFSSGLAWLTQHPVSEEMVYAYSKEAVIAWTIACAGALHRQHGVRMNCVSPGPVDTPILEDFRNTLGRAKVANAIELMGRPGHPQDIAPVVSFLCHPDSRWIAGENIRVDGSLTASRTA
jgi:NAD(P)-dependent dehydrogenase (short-subunit alcohol dehydrogenase family)